MDDWKEEDVEQKCDGLYCGCASTVCIYLYISILVPSFPFWDDHKFLAITISIQFPVLQVWHSLFIHCLTTHPHTIYVFHQPLAPVPFFPQHVSDYWFFIFFQSSPRVGLYFSTSDFLSSSQSTYYFIFIAFNSGLRLSFSVNVSLIHTTNDNPTQVLSWYLTTLVD